MGLLGHIMRREPQELRRRLATDENLCRSKQLCKRVGATHLNLITDNLDRAHAKSHDGSHSSQYDDSNAEHVQNSI